MSEVYMERRYWKKWKLLLIYFFLFYAFFLKKIELYNIFNRFPLLEMGKILKFLTEDNQYDFLVIKERISQCNVKHNRLAMHC